MSFNKFCLLFLIIIDVKKLIYFYETRITTTRNYSFLNSAAATYSLNGKKSFKVFLPVQTHSGNTVENQCDSDTQIFFTKIRKRDTHRSEISLIKVYQDFKVFHLKSVIRTLVHHPLCRPAFFYEFFALYAIIHVSLDLFIVVVYVYKKVVFYRPPKKV
jgi:hypothetical protein